MANLNQGGRPAVFTRGSMAGVTGKMAALSPLQEKKQKFDTIVIERGGIIIVKRGICATSILTKALCGDYPHTIHWPELSKYGKPLTRNNGHDPNLFAVISDANSKLFLYRGDEAEEIIAGKIPEGYDLEFIPPQKKTKKK